MRLLVVRRKPPLNSSMRPSARMMAAHPPGPGLPVLAPSVKISIIGVKCHVSSATIITVAPLGVWMNNKKSLMDNVPKQSPQWQNSFP
jgi:hypothetical protein